MIGERIKRQKNQTDYKDYFSESSERFCLFIVFFKLDLLISLANTFRDVYL